MRTVTSNTKFKNTVENNIASLMCAIAGGSVKIWKFRKMQIILSVAKIFFLFSANFYFCKNWSLRIWFCELWNKKNHGICRKPLSDVRRILPMDKHIGCIIFAQTNKGACPCVQLLMQQYESIRKNVTRTKHKHEILVFIRVLP